MLSPGAGEFPAEYVLAGVEEAIEDERGHLPLRRRD